MQIAAIMMLCLTGPLFAAEPAGYWRSRTPGRTKNLDCQVVKDEIALKRELTGIRWDMEQLPDVDWSNNVLVLIAPSKAPRGWLLSFFRLSEPRTGLEVEWGWALPTANNRRTMESVGEPGDGPAAIAIAFSKTLADKGVTCKEVKSQ